MDKHIEIALRKAITNELSKLISDEIVERYSDEFASQSREIERIKAEQQILLQQAARDTVEQ